MTLLELFLLTMVLFQESSIQTPEAQHLVAWVTVNRVNHEWYPDDVRDVVYQPSQYEWTENPQKMDESNKSVVKKWRELEKIATKVLENRSRPPNPCLMNFHDTSVTPNWAKDKRMRLYKHIQNQKFYIDTKCEARL